MANSGNPNYSPVAATFKSLLSVSSSGSMVGGLRGIYCNASASCTLVSNDGVTVQFLLLTGVTLWMQAAYCSQLSVAATNDLVALL